jgi:hypothetical protein
MADGVDYFELQCPACGNTEVCGFPQMLEYLRQIGMFRRQSEPQADLLPPLFQEKAGQFRCRRCANVGLQVGCFQEDPWEDDRRCAVCRQSIPPARLELFPDASRCAACQAAEESGPEPSTEFCSKCGNILRLRPSRGSGVTRYVLWCAQCGR